MPASYLHGVETIQGSNGVSTIQVVKTAVIGLIGIAPAGPVNVPVLVQNSSDAAQFGKPLPGFDIPQALKIILAMGAGPIIVVNTFDVAANTTQVTSEAKTITNGKLKLAAAPIGAVTIKNSDNTDSTLVAGTDYTLDAYGNFTALSSNASNGKNLLFTYKKLNGASVAGSQIIGSVDVDNNRTGLECLDLAKNTFGFTPKILIAPNYSSLSAVAAALIGKTSKYRAIAYLDAPSGTTVSAAIAGRALAGSINFNTSDKRTELLFPFITAYDEATDSNVNFPYSPFMAGLRSSVDLNEGYWVSTSNHEIIGALGMAVSISAGINDPNTDANLLNASGISTLFNATGTGIRAWGNRNASFPTNTAPDSFTSDVRTADIIHESIENALLPYIDKPISPALIDVVLESINSFVRVLIGRGALVSGSRVEFPKEDNTPTELAAGHLTYQLVRMVPPPFERGTIKDVIDISLLKNLVQ